VLVPGMFRASDIFGRRPSATINSTVPYEPMPGQKRALSSGAASRTWNPATGKYVDEEMPSDIQELMGIRKKAKVLVAGREELAWGGGEVRRTLGGVLGSAVRGSSSTVKQEVTHRVGPPAPIKEVDKTAPSVEYMGFSKVDLNDRYYERATLMLHGRPTYWNEEVTFFVYWQGEVQRWAICDASSFQAVKAGQYPGWAYKEDHRHLSLAGGWMEAFNGTWQQPDLDVTTRSYSYNKAQWEDSILQKGIATIEFRGFAMQELNTRYFLKDAEIIQGKPSYWDDSGVYFIYWQQDMKRWAICDLKCHEAVKSGQCPGWAYRADGGHFANACGWMEQRAGEWAAAKIETGVVATCTKGLKVEFSGFTKEELNTQYTEKADEEIQGKPSFWDTQNAYFVYWQSSYSRWAICDSVSLNAAQKGLSPGWAFGADSKHFAKSRNWMENWGRDWTPTNIKCTVLEGTVREEASKIKAELAEETTAMLSGEQYSELLEKVYEERNPSKLADLPGLLEKFVGREKALYDMVCSKYSVDAEEFAKTSGVVAAVAAEAGDDDDYAQHENEELPVLTQRQYAVRVQNVYVKYNTKKLEDLPRLLKKFRHRERDLYLEVCKKYAVHPTKFHYRCLSDEANA